MAYVVNLTCPRCGAAVSTEQKTCEYCHSPIVIENLNHLNNLNINEYIKIYNNLLETNNDNEDINNSIAMCYLKLKFYDKAIQHFDKALDSNVNNSDIYFYYAIALLKGKKPFLTPLSQIKRIIELLNTAITLENKAIYHYFLAYIKYDFYERKKLNMSPNYLDEYNTVKNNISKNEIITLFEVLGQKIPDVIEV